MREKLCEEIAYMWRYAENDYLDSDCSDGTSKDRVFEYQQKMQLTEEETQLVEDIASGMGV